jgi:Lon protease-like protein
MARLDRTVAFRAAALKLFEGRKSKVKNGSVDLPDEVPVMPLPGAVLFPHALLPLYIFEDRYRDMLEHALQHDRMFSVTLIKPSCPEWHAPEDFFHFATVGLIRACVGRGDGASNLVLQGLHRVRFSDFRQETPFPIAKIDIIESRNDTATVETEALGEKVLELYQKLKRAPASAKSRSLSCPARRSRNARRFSCFNFRGGPSPASTHAGRIVVKRAIAVAHHLLAGRNREYRLEFAGQDLSDD